MQIYSVSVGYLGCKQFVALPNGIHLEWETWQGNFDMLYQLLSLKLIVHDVSNNNNIIILEFSFGACRSFFLLRGLWSLQK